MAEIKLTINGTEYLILHSPFGDLSSESIELIVNKNTYTAIPMKKETKDKDFEIISYINLEGIIDNIENKPLNAYWYKDDKNWKIHSVKRLSDGEVFAICDNTNQGEIKKFSIWQDNIIVHFENQTRQCGLSVIEKVKPKVPLLTKDQIINFLKDNL